MGSDATHVRHQCPIPSAVLVAGSSLTGSAAAPKINRPVAVRRPNRQVHNSHVRPNGDISQDRRTDCNAERCGELRETTPCLLVVAPQLSAVVNIKITSRFGRFMSSSTWTTPRLVDCCPSTSAGIVGTALADERMVAVGAQRCAEQNLRRPPQRVIA
jgi:hypothetical protein